MCITGLTPQVLSDDIEMQLLGLVGCDTTGCEDGTADRFRVEVVSLLVMTVMGLPDASGSWRATC
jgi:hypothetical protein